jgi:hypothetical protein
MTDYHSVALIPLRSSEETVGLLHVGHLHRHRFSRDSLLLLEDLAVAISGRLQSMRVEEALRTSREELKRELTERKKLLSGSNAELKSATKMLRRLNALLPICANCKSIRDDEGYWSQLEQYFSEHSQVLFSHSLCPDCAQKLYPDLPCVQKLRKKRRPPPG